MMYSGESGVLLAPGQSKINLYRERYQNLRSRCLRNPMFAKSVPGVTGGSQTFKV